MAILGRAYHYLTGLFPLTRNFSVTISVSPYVCFILVLNLISMFLRYYIYEQGIFYANQTIKCLRNHGRTKCEGWSTANYLKSTPPPTPPGILLLVVLRRLFCFGSLVILDVVCRYLSLFVLYINIEIGKNRC